MQPDRVAQSKAWGVFWRESAADDCTSAFPLEAQERLASGWRMVLERLPPGARLLDLACGKGAVLRHAVACGVVAPVGIDVAPGAAIAGSGFDLRGGIDACALPFDPLSFDVVVSQFGVEYAGIERAADEAARVSRAAIILMVHAAEGVVVAHAAEQVSHEGLLERDLRAYDRLKSHFATPTHESAADVDALLAAIAGHIEHAANSSLLVAVYHAAISLQDEADPMGGVDGLAASVRNHAGRMRALLEAAPDEARTRALAERLERGGFRVELRAEGGGDVPLIGRWVLAQRS